MKAVLAYLSYHENNLIQEIILDVDNLGWKDMVEKSRILDKETKDYIATLSNDLGEAIGCMFDAEFTISITVVI